MQEKHWQAQNQPQQKSPKAPKKIKHKKKPFKELIKRLDHDK